MKEGEEREGRKEGKRKREGEKQGDRKGQEETGKKKGKSLNWMHPFFVRGSNSISPRPSFLLVNAGNRAPYKVVGRPRVSVITHRKRTGTVWRSGQTLAGFEDLE